MQILCKLTCLQSASHRGHCKTTCASAEQSNDQHELKYASQERYLDEWDYLAGRRESRRYTLIIISLILLGLKIAMRQMIDEQVKVGMSYSRKSLWQPFTPSQVLGYA